jgi:hypothetical protein
LIVFAPSAFAAKKCPSQVVPAPGATVKGGLEIDGGCILSDVTVKGGIIVNAGAVLELGGTTVNGGVVVMPGAELDSIEPSTINGGLFVDSPKDLNLRGGRVNGGVSISGGSPPLILPTICGVNIMGGVNAGNGAVVEMGSDFSFQCAGNIIRGTVIVQGASVPNFNNNTVSGSLICVDGGTVYHDLSVPDSNKIRGSNTCY